MNVKTKNGCIVLCAVSVPLLPVDEKLPDTVDARTTALALPLAGPCGIVCECAASSAGVNTCVSSPPVAARVRAVSPLPVPLPTGERPRGSGRLNVVDPSPAPNVVPITPNKVA